MVGEVDWLYKKLHDERRRKDAFALREQTMRAQDAELSVEVHGKQETIRQATLHEVSVWGKRFLKAEVLHAKERRRLEVDLPDAHQNKSSGQMWATHAKNTLEMIEQRQVDLLETVEVKNDAHVSGWFRKEAES